MKLSVLLLYRRIFITTRYRIYSLITYILVILWCVGYFLGTALQCGAQPSNFWSSQEASKTLCVDTNELQLTLGVFDVATDLLILAMAVLLLWNLALPSPQHVAVVATALPGLL